MVPNDVMEQTINELDTLIEAHDFAALRELTKNWHAGDLADVMEPLSPEKEAIVFRLLPRQQAAKVFTYLPEDRQKELLRGLAQHEVADLFNAMSPDDRTSLLEELPAKATLQMLNSLSSEERTVASQLLGYPEHSVGRLMTPDFVRVRAEWTVSHALDHIRRYGVDSETMSMVYVIDAQGKLVDDLRLRQLLLAPPDANVTDLMDNRYIALKATDDREVAVEAFKDFGPDRAAGDRYRRCAAWHCDGGRHPGRGGKGGHGGHPEDWRLGGAGRALHADLAAEAGAKARKLAGDPVPERDAYGDRHGQVRD